MAQFTKKAIISTFLQLLSKYSLDKITVKDIVEKCGINRNTFYYYYKDIYDLIEDIFRIEIQSIRENSGNQTSFQGELQQGISIILENKAAFAHLYHSRSREIIEKYLDDISESFTKRYVEQKALELSIKHESDIRFVYDWYQFAISGIILKWIQADNASDPDTFIRRVASLYENTIAQALLSTEKINSNTPQQTNDT